VKLLKSLKLKKKREELGLVLVEGHRMVIDAMNNGLQPVVVLYTDKAKGSPLGYALNEAMDGFRGQGQENAVLEVGTTILCYSATMYYYILLYTTIYYYILLHTTTYCYILLHMHTLTCCPGCRCPRV
jgi:hypothetical protein